MQRYINQSDRESGVENLSYKPDLEKQASDQAHKDFIPKIDLDYSQEHHLLRN
jgi:hypothetical protein